MQHGYMVWPSAAPLAHYSDGIQDLGDFCLYWWGWCGGFGRSQRLRAFVPIIKA